MFVSVHGLEDHQKEDHGDADTRSRYENATTHEKSHGSEFQKFRDLVDSKPCTNQ
jgi:hypothetical protein